MKTQIKNIKKVFDEKKNEHYYVIYFDYGDFIDAFTYLTKKSLAYWKDRGVTKLKLGIEIDVFKVKDTKYFKIVSIGGL